MKKFLLSLFAVLTASTMLGQKVTLDFTDPVGEWGFPLKANAVTETANFSNGTYTVTVVGGTDTGVYAGGSDKNGYTYLMMGKQGAALILPAFDFAVGKIVVTGNTGASKGTVMNVYVGETAVSTETTGSSEANTYDIAEGYQAAGNVYALKVTSKHNAQITKIEIYESGVDPTPDPGTSIANTPETAYTASEALDILASDADLSPNVYVKGSVASISELSTEYGNATFFLTDGSKELYIFRAKYLEGTTFTAEDQLKVGDEVIACGQLKNYVKDDTTTPELSNCYTYSVNGKTKLDGSGEETKTITVAEAQALTSGTAKVNATVYAVCKNGAVFGDQTGYIYYYNTGISGLAIGDQVTVEGALSKYGGFNQFTSAATVTKTGSAAVTYPAAAEMDVDAWVAAPAIQYVKLTGELSVSGNYYNILVEGKTAQGSVVGAQDELFKDIASGSTITVEGFAMYTTSGGKYANIVATKVTVDGQGETPEAKEVSVAQALEVIAALEDNAKTTDEYAVKGFVVGTPDFQRKGDGTLYGNVNLTIADEKGGTTTLTIFRAKYLEGENFTEETITAINEGDEVVFQGLLQKYVKEETTTPELVSGKLISVVATGISQIVNGKSSDGAIYDLSGRRVEKAVKGIYIVNGKKFVK